MQRRFWRSSSRRSVALPRSRPGGRGRAAGSLCDRTRASSSSTRRSPGLRPAPTRSSPASNSTASCSISASPRRSSTMPRAASASCSDGPLDMRMTQARGQSAADVVNGASEAELIRIFRDFGEERLRPAHRARHRRRPASAAVRAHPRARRDDRARARRVTREPAQASGDAHLSGAAHLHQRRARSSSRAALDAALERSRRRGASRSSAFIRSRIAW